MIAKHTLAILLAGAALATPSVARAAPSSSETLAALISDHWSWYLDTNPVFASTLGDRRNDRKLADISLDAMDRQTATARGFVARLDAISEVGLTPQERADRAVLRRLLAEQAAGNGFLQRMMLFTTYYSWHQAFAGMGDDLPFRAKADYEAYIARLEAYPAFNRTAIDITRKALGHGLVHPCAVLGNFERSISGLIVEDPSRSRNYAPFLNAKPLDASDVEWEELRNRAKRVILDALNPAHRALLAFWRDEYMPQCRASVGVDKLPGGKAYYAHRVAAETTTDLTPDQIHRIGLDEVARISAEMEAVAREAGFADRAAYVAHLRSDPSYYAKTPDELMRAAALVAKTIDGKMPAYFTRLPRLPYGLRPIPAEIAEMTTTAYYGPGSPESGISGTYWLNTSKLAQRPLFELPALTMHEAVPGHHHQIALQQELTLPPFRRHVASFTAFTEGWALYTERLGIEMGLYDTPAKKMGRLSYEMWRACRLVVDTGIHAKGWSKARAIDFMKANTALSEANIEAEVNRYISWPGQALGYKLGEIRIRALRAKAEAALGAKFDLRRFHDAVLGQGSIPLDLLDRQIDDWIAGEKSR